MVDPKKQICFAKNQHSQRNALYFVTVHQKLGMILENVFEKLKLSNNDFKKTIISNLKKKSERHFCLFSTNCH